MASDVRRKTVTIPPGTAKAAPLVSDLSFPARVVVGLEIVVPPGPHGEVGFALGAAGVAVLPAEAGAYVVTDGEVVKWPLEGFWDSGSWQMHSYNTGRYPHTLEVRFLCDLPVTTTPAAAPVTVDQLTATFQSAPVVTDSTAAAPSSPSSSEPATESPDLGGAPPAPVFVG